MSGPHQGAGRQAVSGPHRAAGKQVVSGQKGLRGPLAGQLALKQSQV